MKNNFVNRNAKPNGDHEVHHENCVFLPLPVNLMDLGYCNDCHEAVAKAKQHYSTADGCVYCSPGCHKR